MWNESVHGYASTLPRFHASTLPRFHASTLPRFHASTLHYRLCSAALIGVAALSLAACGSGGGESTDPGRLSALEDREKKVASREAAVSQKEKDQAAKDLAQARKDDAQAAKDREQAAKDRELNNRPPRVVTRTVQAPPTGPTHVGFSGGNFTSKEIAGLSSVVSGIQPYPTLWLGHPTESPALVYSKLLGRLGGFLFPELISSVSDSNVSYRLKVYKIDSTDDRSGSLVTTNNSSGLSNDGWKIYELTSPTDITGLGLSDTFTYKLFKGEVDPRRTDTASTADDAKFHAEVATDYASDNTNDWLQFGWWVQVPKQTDNLNDYNIGVFADANHQYKNSRSFNALTGTVTHTGSMMGLHTDIDSDGKHTLSRLTGKASLAVDFGNGSAPGTITGTFNELKLNGTDAAGSMTFTKTLQNAGTLFQFFEGAGNSATINGSNYKGGIVLKWVNSTDADATTKPTGVIGTLKGITDDGSKAFSAAFGARPE